MKTMKFFYASLAVLAMMLTFSACDMEDDPWRDDDTDYLTSRTWVEEWTDDNDVFHHQELDFYPDGTGQDYLYTEDYDGYAQHSTLRFTWGWDVRYSISMRYGANDYSYFSHISMGRNRLEGVLDGVSVSFQGK